jgi:hypothetical protein
MAGTTYNNSYPNGLVLNNPNSTIASTAVVNSSTATAVYGTGGASWTVTNYGSVHTSGTASFATGIELAGGGTIINKTSGKVGGNNGQAIAIGLNSSDDRVAGAVGTVINSGTVTGGGTAGIGVLLEEGGSLTNNANAVISAQGDNSAVFIDNGAGTVTNFGTIKNTDGGGVHVAKGEVINEDNGVIIGGTNGHSVTLAAPGTNETYDGRSTLTNYGRITDASTADAAVYVGPGGGSVSNGTALDSKDAYISSARTGLSFKGAGTATNFGIIKDTATGTSGTAVYFSAGGSFTNETGALVESDRNGVSTADVAASVVNFGTIENIATPGNGGEGIYLGAGGRVTNETTGRITSVSDPGISTKGGSATVVNYGYVETSTTTKAVSIYLGAGGSLTNGSSSNHTATIKSPTTTAVSMENAAAKLVNFGVISGGTNSVNTANTGVYMTGGGTITNEAGAAITGVNSAITLRKTAGTVLNYGSVSSNGGTTHATVYVTGGGSLTNGSTSVTNASISGSGSAIVFRDAPATVTNFATISSTGATFDSAVYLGDGGSVTNKAGALITSTANGVLLANVIATLTNFGTVKSTGSSPSQGVAATSGGDILNESGAVITANADGVFIGGTNSAATVLTNKGDITGVTGVGVSVSDTAAVTIINYATISGTGGLAIQLAGSAATVVIKPNSVLTGAISAFAVGDTIDFADKVGNSAVLVGQTLALLNEGSLVSTVNLSGVFSSDSFVVKSDGAGGTDVQMVGVPPAQNDLTGDGLSDSIMIDPANGVIILDEVQNGSMTYQEISQIGPQWKFAGEGPLSGDGRDQGLLWNDSTGALVIGEVGDGKVAYQQIGVLGPVWQFEGVGPLAPGSSNAEFLIWNDSTGALVLGAVSGSQASYTQIGSVGPEWSYEGVGDFLGNGSTQFLMWDTDNASSSYGALVVGQDVSANTPSTQYTAIGGLGPTTWQVEGSGDLLGDNRDSILLHNSSSGALEVAEVDTANNDQVQYTAIGGVGNEWQFLGVGDYDGKSPSEFLMFNAGTNNNGNGTLEIGTVTGSAGHYSVTYTPLGGVGPSEWTFHPNSTTPALLS